MLQAIRAGLARRAREWAWRRQGPDGASVVLDSKRIYILPTRAGTIFALIVFTMLLGAMNYSNNMGFALTFLLTGVGIVSIYQCHRNLAGLELRALGAAPVFAGQALQFRFMLTSADGRPRGQLHIGWDGDAPRVLELAAGRQAMLQLPVPTATRGVITAPRVQISTIYPLGLCRAWAWLAPDVAGLAYPRPAGRLPAIADSEAISPAPGSTAQGDEDFAGLRAWRPGDPPRRIAWKALARTGQTLVTEYRGSAPVPIWIDWAREPETERERRIARLARRVIDADAAGQAYGLRLPAGSTAPGQGPGQRHRCLRALALLPGSAAGAAS